MSRPWHALSLLAGLVVMGCVTYCLVWYKPAETSFWNPDVAVTCWLYCATLSPYWGIATLVSGILPVLAVAMARVGHRRLSGSVAILAGVVTLPAGLLPMVAGFLTLMEGTGRLK